MQYRGGRHSEVTNGNLRKSNNREYSCTENSDSSDECEEDTHISYQFRRWANHIWSVSNNVTNRLRDLIRNNPSSTSATSDHSEENFLDESDATSWTTSSDAIESWDRINDGSSNKRRYRQHPKNHHETPRENYSRYDQKYCPVTEDHRMRHVPANRAENSPAFVMGHNVATYPPVLILPRVHHGVNQQSTRTGFYQSRHQMSRCHNAHGDQYADGWYQQYNHRGKQWGYEGSRRAEYNYSAPLNRQKIPEKISSSVDDPRIKRLGRKSTKIEPNDRNYRSVKHFSTHVRDFRSEDDRNGHESVSPTCDNRRSREESFSRSSRQKNYGDLDAPRKSSHCLKTSAHSTPKKVGWDLQLSDITSREPSTTNLSRVDHSAKSYDTSNSGRKREFIENVEIPVKDNEKQQEVLAPHDQVTNAVEASKISHDTQPQPSCNINFSENKNSEKENNNLQNGYSAKWSSKNGVDSLLQSLRERMKTLSNIHPPNFITTSGSMECKKKETACLAKKECIVASCLTSTYHPECLEYRHNKTTVDTVETNEEGRPSFSERIQDIWQHESDAWKSSPDHELSNSSYDLKSGKNASSKLSLLGFNQQPALREYFGEHNSTVTLARILEKLIDSKTKSDLVSQRVITKAPKPPPRSNRKQSNTSVKVNVGVQKSVPTSTTASQEPASCFRHRSTERRRSRRSFRRTFESHVSEFPIETSRPLQVFSGQSIIPISSIQFTAPVIHPIPNVPGFAPPFQDPRPSSNCNEDRIRRHGDFIITDNPLIKESHHATKRGPSSSARETSLGVKDGRPISNEEESNRRLINEQEQILSFVYEEIEQERHYAKSVAHLDTATGKQHALHYSVPVRLEERKIAEDRADPELEDMSAKSRSWWPKKFHFNKTGALKEKISSFLKYVTKKHTAVDCQTQKYYFDETVIQTVIPTPPIRVRRKSVISALKCSKSIQWDLDTLQSVSQCTETSDLVHVIENPKLNKSTSVSPMVEKVTVASGTNTNKKKPRKTNSKCFLTQKEEVSVGPKIIQDSEETCTDFSSELPAICDQDLVESGIIVHAEELPIDNQPSFKDLSISAKEDIRPSTQPGQKQDKNLIEEQKFKVSRSLSSKIPLATKPVSQLNVSSRICRKRPSTAPMLDNSSSSSLQSNETLGVLKARKSFGREYASQDTTKKMLFKPNRSSLLRANNSMLKKSAKEQSKTWINTTWNKDMERKCMFKDLTSPVKIDKEKSSPNLSSVNETSCEKIVTEKELEVEQSDSLSNTSGHKTKQTDLKYSSNIETENLEHSKDEEPSPKVKTASLDVKPRSSHAFKGEEKSMMNMEVQKLSVNESIISGSVDLLEQKPSRKINPKLPNRKNEANFEAHVNVNGEETPELTDFKESKGSSNKISFNSANVSELQIEKEFFLTEHSLFQDQSEGAFAFRVDRMRNRFNKRTVELQPQLAHSPARKTAKCSLKHHDVHAKKIVSRDKKTPTLKQWERLCLLTKSIPSSTFTPQHHITNDPANNESNVNLSELSVSNDHSQNRNAEASEFEKRDLVTVNKSAENASRVSTNEKNCKVKLTKMNRARHKKTDVILEMVRKILGVAIDNAVNVNRETNFVSLKQNIHQCISPNSGKSSDLSTDSLEPIHVRNTSNNSDDMLKVTVENRKESVAARLFEIPHHITQSIITFDLTEIADKPEKLRPSIFNVRLERSVEIGKSRLVDSKDKFKHEKLSDASSDLKVMDDENNCKSSKGGRNVKIDNKVLVEKVKSSIENGVPLKTITITDPAILKHSNLIPYDKIPPANKIFQELNSETKKTPSKKVCNTSRDALSDAKSEGECSHTTWASHKNHDIDIGDRTVPEIPSKSDNVERHLEVSNDQNNSVANTPSLKSNKKPTRFRGTLIPRYTKFPSTRQ